MLWGMKCIKYSCIFSKAAVSKCHILEVCFFPLLEVYSHGIKQAIVSYDVLSSAYTQEPSSGLLHGLFSEYLRCNPS